MTIYLCNKILAARLAEAIFDTGHDARQVGLGDRVVDKSPLFLRRQESAVLHEAQMLRRHVTGKVAGFRELSHAVAAPEQHLHHPQAVRVRERPQALGRLARALPDRAGFSSS